MNTTMIAQTVNDNWVVEIQECDFVTPYLLGEMDAQDNQPCVPEMYYMQRKQMQEYARGYESVKGWTLLSAAILRPDEAAAYTTGVAHYNHNRYSPPNWDCPTYTPYLRGYNDAWAAANNRKLAR